MKNDRVKKQWLKVKEKEALAMENLRQALIKIRPWKIASYGDKNRRSRMAKAVLCRHCSFACRRLFWVCIYYWAVVLCRRGDISAPSSALIINQKNIQPRQPSRYTSFRAVSRLDRALVTCKIKHLQNIFKNVYRFILHVTSLKHLRNIC